MQHRIIFNNKSNVYYNTNIRREVVLGFALLLWLNQRHVYRSCSLLSGVVVTLCDSFAHFEAVVQTLCILYPFVHIHVHG